MMFIKYVLRVPLRFSDEQLAIGDYAMHGEEAYVFGEGSAAFVKHHLHGVDREGALVGQDEGGIIIGKSVEATAKNVVQGESVSGSGSGDAVQEEIKKD